MNEIIKKFHQKYYDSGVWWKTKWRGIDVLKCPLDMWIYQELIYKIKPDLIIETGTYHGGSALFFADLLGSFKKDSKIITIDIKHAVAMPKHRMIKYIVGSSTDGRVVKEVSAEAKKAKKVMVILDSLHKAPHVKAEMDIYNKFVSVGSYMIVEDTNIAGNPVKSDWSDGGPAEAVDEFLAKRDNFKVDKGCEKFMVTFNPGGYLKKVK